jgi:hypothetical protein
MKKQLSLISIALAILAVACASASASAESILYTGGGPSGLLGFGRLIRRKTAKA